jgi:two-component system, chemotaxis family, protein-glutamate methylesterase/glutaminase
MNRPHVLVVDDSAVVRQAFSMLLVQHFSVDTAADPLIAERKIRKRRPDVVVLDLQMPRMDGFTFLRQIMRTDPLPVVICSAAAARGSDAAMRALEEGALDVIAKPPVGVREFIAESSVLIGDTLRAAALSRVVVRPRPVVTPLPPARMLTDRIVAAGASTGGTEALREIIESLPPGAPGMLVVQHMPEGFTAAFAKRLDSTARVEVKEAASGDAVVPGRVLIAPGSQHMLLRRSGSRYYVQLCNGPLVSRHRPSVDVLFRSVAQAAGANATGVILTGMGDDGAEGLAEMRAAGARTIAQDESTSVIFGMPKEAIARGAAGEVLPLPRIAGAIITR